MTSKPRCLGLDVGEKRIGIAISDPFGTTAAGLETIDRTTLQADITAIADIARRHNAVEIIVGMPVGPETGETNSPHVIAFGKKLAQATGLPVIYEDERLGTVSAIRTLTVQQGDNNPFNEMRHELADKQQAAIILQKHLDRREPPPSA